MKSIANDVKLHVRSDAGWERIVMAEVLIPDTPNVFGDYWTKENIKEAAYAFMRRGFGIDVEHDNVDVTGPVQLVEAFIVRPGDLDFIEGSWVVGMYIGDDAIWADVLSGKINGYSYEAIVSFLSATIQTSDDFVRQGTTEPDPIDGHVHEFVTMVDADNRPIEGGTTVTNGHSHTISAHTITDESEGHVHRYNLVTGKDGK